MLKPVIVGSGKPISIATAAEEMVCGTPLYNGEMFADRDIQYDGLNAVITPLEKDNDTIPADALYLEIPTVLNEQWATTELTPTGLSAGDYLKVADGKFVAAVANDESIWVYVGEYTNPFGVTMYTVKRVPLTVVTA